jgi:hypothetical protein
MLSHEEHDYNLEEEGEYVQLLTDLEAGDIVDLARYQNERDQNVD